MICTQDLWAIKSMLADFKYYCTCEEAVDNLIDEVEKEIDERDNIQKADRYRKTLEEIEKYCSNAQDPCQDNWTREKENFAKIILDIIRREKGEE